jgi:hypothetical protein
MEAEPPLLAGERVTKVTSLLGNRRHDAPDSGEKRHG